MKQSNRKRRNTKMSDRKKIEEERKRSGERKKRGEKRDSERGSEIIQSTRDERTMQKKNAKNSGQGSSILILPLTPFIFIRLYLYCTVCTVLNARLDLVYTHTLTVSMHCALSHPIQSRLPTNIIFAYIVDCSRCV